MATTLELEVSPTPSSELALSAWLHYALGSTLSQIIEVFNFHLQLPLTEGGLVQMWYRLQAILYAWYEEIQTQALSSAVLHGNETGWRVQAELSSETYASRRRCLTVRLQTLIETDWNNVHARRSSSEQTATETAASAVPTAKPY